MTRGLRTAYSENDAFAIAIASIFGGAIWGAAIGCCVYKKQHVSSMQPNAALATGGGGMAGRGGAQHTL